jgi:hypothetical protein
MEDTTSLIAGLTRLSTGILNAEYAVRALKLTSYNQASMRAAEQKVKDLYGHRGDLMTNALESAKHSSMRAGVVQNMAMRDRYYIRAKVYELRASADYLRADYLSTRHWYVIEDAKEDLLKRLTPHQLLEIARAIDGFIDTLPAGHLFRTSAGLKLSEIRAARCDAISATASSEAEAAVYRELSDAESGDAWPESFSPATPGLASELRQEAFEYRTESQVYYSLLSPLDDCNPNPRHALPCARNSVSTGKLSPLVLIAVILLCKIRFF